MVSTVRLSSKPCAASAGVDAKMRREERAVRKIPKNSTPAVFFFRSTRKIDSPSSRGQPLKAQHRHKREQAPYPRECFRHLQYHNHCRRRFLLSKWCSRHLLFPSSMKRVPGPGGYRCARVRLPFYGKRDDPCPRRLPSISAKLYVRT